MERWRNLDQGKKDHFVEILRDRFENQEAFHPGGNWGGLLKKIGDREEIFEALYFMEITGGQPGLFTQVIEDHWVFFDTVREIPKERVSLCYDQKALLARKKNPPKGSVEGLIKGYQVELLEEDIYRRLQEIFPFDLKNSSWIETPKEVRQLGGALFCHRRYNRVFVFHNGADSYYSSRGYRLMVKL